jgi:hypothetical protein
MGRATLLQRPGCYKRDRSSRLPRLLLDVWKNVMSDDNRTEFVVQQDKLGLVIGRDGRTKLRIERLFDVQVDLTSHGQPDGEWVTLRGREDSRKKAQVRSGRSTPCVRNRKDRSRFLSLFGRSSLCRCAIQKR